MLKTRASVGTPLGVSKFDFSDNFVSKNSAQMQNFPNWHCREVNLVDCIVLCILGFHMTSPKFKLRNYRFF